MKTEARDADPHAKDDKGDSTLTHDPQAQKWLYAIAVFCVLAAICHGFYPASVDHVTAIFLALAAAAVVLPQVTRFKVGKDGVEVEKLASDNRRLQNELNVVKEFGSVPAPKKVSVAARSRTFAAAAKGGRKAPGGKNRPDPDDPNKGKFGGSPTANGRILEAALDPISGERSAACLVQMTVRSTDASKPLSGDVVFHLHPTFGKFARYVMKGIGSQVNDSVVAWGAFTIGVECVGADGKPTKLELDLMDVDGGTNKFYDN